MGIEKARIENAVELNVRCLSGACAEKGTEHG